jgi:hypothetical protein
MSSEAMFAREVHQILAFSCQAAENALADTQPAVVAKLREGRARRLAAAEKVVSAARKELDQRSLETVNSAALQLAPLAAGIPHSKIGWPSYTAWTKNSTFCA